ncbi:Noelin-3 [Desmophyllum pertusum]|uniref:Noelin-3 n=1 Tax=Desmophyllum pertusum TaxID=174260 RepID=A0A9W9ZHD4_9CNID|nr:Noelin-3 [Desmophyllum pertusum]
MVSRYLPLLCCALALLLGEGLGNSSVSGPRNKRSSYSSSKPSVKDIALELAKTHLLKMIADERADLNKAKESVYILQRDRCTNIKSVGKPVTHNTRQFIQGAWMKDPLGIMGTETIFVMESYYSKNVVEEFENMDMFKAGVARKTYKLPYKWMELAGWCMDHSSTITEKIQAISSSSICAQSVRRLK